MGQALAITRTEHTAEALREFAAKSRDGAQVRRLLAIALILEGRSRTDAAELSGMDRQTLRDWVHRYNAAGIAGLTSRCSPGRPPALDAAQMDELEALVIKGPEAHDRPWSGTTVTTPHISTPRSAPVARSVRPSSCPRPTPKA